MSRDDLIDRSNVIGRTVADLMAMGRELDASLGEEGVLSPFKPSTTPLTTTPKNALTIPSVQFSSRQSLPVQFSGYSRQTVEDSWFSQRPDLPARPTVRLDIPTMDQAYITETADLLMNLNPGAPINAFERFSFAIPPEQQDSWMAQVYGIFIEMLTQGRRRDGGYPLTMHILSGARRYLEKKCAQRVKKSVTSEFGRHETGVEMDQTHLEQAFARTQISSNAFYHLRPSSSRDVRWQGWRLLYCALRIGDEAAARLLSYRVDFAPGMTSHTPVALLAEWIDKAGLVALDVIDDMMTMCHALLAQSFELSTDQHYLIRTVSFLCGSIETVDELMKKTGAAWDSLDEWLWFLMGCVRFVPNEENDWLFSVSDLQERINAHSESYFTGDGQNVMRFITPLLCSLQFKRALKFMLNLENRQSSWYVHVVHMAIALEFTGMLDIGGEEDEKYFSRSQIAQVINEYASQFRKVDDNIHHQYRFFVKKLSTDAARSMKEAMLETIMEHILANTRPGVCLSRHSIELIDQNVPSTEERKTWLVNLGDRLRQRGHLEHAYKCYLAGGFYLQALQAINLLVSNKVSDMITEKLMGRDKHFGEDIHHAQLLLNQFMTHHSSAVAPVNLQNTDFAALHDEAEELKRICVLLRAFHNGEYQDCIIGFEKLPFIPMAEGDMEERAHDLRTRFHHILEILHKLFGLFCKALIIQAQVHGDVKGPNDRQAQLAMYQRFIRLLPQNYNFRAPIGAELAKASRHLANV